MSEVKVAEVNHNNPLGLAPISRLIFKFATPSIISMLVTAAYNITDQIFIGNVVGMYGNAATNVVFPTVMLTLAFSQLIGIGTATNFSINMGAKNETEAKGYVGTGLLLMPLVGIILMSIILLFKAPILTLCGATENTFEYSNIYLSITAIGIPFFIFLNAASNLIRADGSPTYSMVCTVVGVILNIFLDWLFMYVFNLGIQGAAIATVIGQFISFIITLVYFRKFKAFNIKFEMLKVRFKYILGIAKLGVSNFINHIIITIVNIVMNNTLVHYGALTIYGSDIPLAVSGVVAKINSILISFAVGLSIGCQPIISFNTGAKNYNRVKETYKKALIISLVICTTIFVIFQLFPRQIVSIFGTGNELYFEFAEKYVRIFLMFVCLFGIQPLSVNYFTSTGNMKQGIILSLSRQGFLLIPLLIILPIIFGLDGILYAGSISDFLAAVLSLTMVFLHFRTLDKQEVVVNK